MSIVLTHYKQQLNQMATFVIVHGNWDGGWIWTPLHDLVTMQ